jgi:hypothetical protein
MKQVKEHSSLPGCDTMSYARADIQKDTVSLSSETGSSRSYSLQGLLCTSKEVKISTLHPPNTL